MKKFNTAGICFPEEHYRVNISERIYKSSTSKTMVAMVDGRKMC